MPACSRLLLDAERMAEQDVCQDIHIRHGGLGVELDHRRPEDPPGSDARPHVADGAKRQDIQGRLVDRSSGVKQPPADDLQIRTEGPVAPLDHPDLPLARDPVEALQHQIDAPAQLGVDPLRLDQDPLADGQADLDIQRQRKGLFGGLRRPLQDHIPAGQDDRPGRRAGDEQFRQAHLAADRQFFRRAFEREARRAQDLQLGEVDGLEPLAVDASPGSRPPATP